MSKAAGAKRPSESQKAKALWAVKTANGRRDEFFDSTRKKKFWEENRKILELLEEHLQDPVVALDKALKCVQNQYQG